MRSRTSVALLCTALLAACFSDPPAGPEEGNGEAVVVRMAAELTFEPATIQVTTGQSVRWENVYVLPHTATGNPARAADPDNVELPPGAAAWDSGIINAGGTYTRTFTTPGTYRYVCLPHESGGMVGPGTLTLHADRGSSMRSRPVALLLSDLGVTKTHSRPHVSNDNPFSEAQFRTMKYRPEFPDRFGSIQDARVFSEDFFRWYNTMHRHSGIGLLTPADLHHGRGEERREQRSQVLAKAFEARPERFVRGCPQPPALPAEVWINEPLARRPEPAAGV